METGDVSLEEFSVNPDYFLDEFMHMLKTNRFCKTHQGLRKK
jgi:hypothetical protein